MGGSEEAAQIEGAHPEDGPRKKMDRLRSKAAATAAAHPTAENEDGRRPRWRGYDLLRDVIIGYTGVTEDGPALPRGGTLSAK